MSFLSASLLSNPSETAYNVSSVLFHRSARHGKLINLSHPGNNSSFPYALKQRTTTAHCLNIKAYVYKRFISTYGVFVSLIFVDIPILKTSLLHYS